MKHAPGQLIWHAVCSYPPSFQKGSKKLTMDQVDFSGDSGDSLHLTAVLQTGEGLV